MCLLCSCTAGKSLKCRLGRSGQGLRFPEEPSSGQSQSPGWYFFQQKSGQVREKTGPEGPAFLVPLLLMFSSPCLLVFVFSFFFFDRFRFLTTLLGSTQTPASNTDLSVTQWPTAPSAHSSSPSKPSNLVRDGGERGEGAARFPSLALPWLLRISLALSGFWYSSLSSDALLPLFTGFAG